MGGRVQQGVPPPPIPALLAEILRAVPRRYRLREDGSALAARQATPASALAWAIELSREALVEGRSPTAALRAGFLDALADLIREALRPESGDPAFQARVLRHGSPVVQEYAGLAAHAAQDARTVLALVHAIAHPAKLERLPRGVLHDALARVQAAAAARHWAALDDALARLAGLSDLQRLPGQDALGHGVKRLLEGPALARLRRRDALASDDGVRRYEALLDASGPRSGSAVAAEQGRIARERGRAVESAAAHAFAMIACRLNDAEGEGMFRAVTTMRVPSAFPASRAHAKTEWDVVLLRCAGTQGDQMLWDVCLLAEAKSSPDAATTDWPRLQRGLQLFARADEHAAYPFDAAEETVWVRGASLRAFAAANADKLRTVLYCCLEPGQAMPRMLGASSRMQLLSARPSLEFAHAVSGGKEDVGMLEPLWNELLQSPRWRAVLHQYPTLGIARAAMVHLDDLNDTVASSFLGTRGKRS